MKRPLGILLVSCAFALSSCSLTPDPKPNGPLLDLASTALNDAAALRTEAPQLSKLRSEQAEALFSEVRRLCGQNKEGQTPQSCTVPTADASPTPDTEGIADKARASTLEKAGEIPQESIPKVARMYTQLAMLGTQQKSPDSPNTDIAAANKALEWEYATVYALKVALAYAGQARSDVNQAIAEHEKTAADLHNVISKTPGAEAAAAAPSYDISAYPQPKDEASAREFLAEVETDTTQRWSISAAESSDAAWRKFALAQSGNAAVAATAALKAAGQDPFAARFATSLLPGN